MVKMPVSFLTSGEKGQGIDYFAFLILQNEKFGEVISLPVFKYEIAFISVCR